MQDKVVGEQCNTCGTPYIMGKKGAYCKPCYIKWANDNKTQNNAPAPNANNATQEVDWDKISFGKCKFGFMVEVYKKTDKIELDELEKIAEELATRAMRILPKAAVQTPEDNIPVPEMPF